MIKYLTVNASIVLRAVQIKYTFAPIHATYYCVPTVQYYYSALAYCNFIMCSESRFLYWFQVLPTLFLSKNIGKFRNKCIKFIIDFLPLVNKGPNSSSKLSLLCRICARQFSRLRKSWGRKKDENVTYRRYVTNYICAVFKSALVLDPDSAIYSIDIEA
jgi:hypothetical protein